MIEFRLDARSGVPRISSSCSRSSRPLRLGILHPGDQLPTVKEVVASLAINPNTVLKAYRELDLEGLTEGRRGQGTFVSSTLPPLRTGPRGCAARSAAEWVRERPRRGPGRRHHGGAVCRHRPPAGRDEGRMSDGSALACDAARQALRLALGAARLHPRDPGRLRDGARRPERRGQDDPAAARRGPDAGRLRETSACSVSRRGAMPRSSFRGSGSSRRSIRSTRASRSPRC